MRSHSSHPNTVSSRRNRSAYRANSGSEHRQSYIDENIFTKLVDD